MLPRVHSRGCPRPQPDHREPEIFAEYLAPALEAVPPVVLAVLLLAPAALVGRRLWRHRPAGPARSLARRGDVAPMLAAPAAAKARALRPSLASRGI